MTRRGKDENGGDGGEGGEGGRGAGLEATNRGGMRESVRQRMGEGERGGQRGDREKGAVSEKSTRGAEGEGGAEFPGARRKAELSKESAAGRSDYLQQSKQDKLSVCISARSRPITLFYPPGLYVDLLVGRWTRYFGVIYGHVTVPRGAVKLQNTAGACIGNIEKSVTAYPPAKARFVAARLFEIYCGAGG